MHAPSIRSGSTAAPVHPEYNSCGLEEHGMSGKEPKPYPATRYFWHFSTPRGARNRACGLYLEHDFLHSIRMRLAHLDLFAETEPGFRQAVSFPWCARGKSLPVGAFFRGIYAPMLHLMSACIRRSKATCSPAQPRSGTKCRTLCTRGAKLYSVGLFSFCAWLCIARNNISCGYGFRPSLSRTQRNGAA